MSDKKTLFLAALISVALSIAGCTTVKYYPANFVESLKHPTKFPEVYAVTVKNIEEIADKNPLEEDEEIKITSVGENKNSSMHLVQVRKNGELYPHYHKRHDEVIYVKKGSGIATLDGSRYLIKPGSILQIPSKTVHKFLNTGDELFVAVSIFSPPFDGRDEKKIKRKKKADRGAKTEKRIVAKKPERVVEEDKTSSVTEPNEEEIQPAKVTSENLAENNLHKPAHEEWDIDSDKPIPPVQHPASEEKKISQDATLAEEPIVNIKDLHEKLTQLLRLKEEGTLSEEEYEEKKDAIVKGKDIGELPQLKSPARNQIPLEDDELISENTEDQVIPQDDFSDEDTYTKNDPDLSNENEPMQNEPIMHEEDEPSESSEDKLQTLDEMMQEGLITEGDYEHKRNEITATEEEAISKPEESVSKDEKIKELKELYEEGLITEEDYESKRKEIVSVDEEKKISTPSKNTSNEEKVEELNDLYYEGLITKDDYEYKLKELTSTQKHTPHDIFPTQNKIQNEKLSELNELKEQGLISEEDYEFKKSQLLGK
ncbi:MAG: hypothetical protein JETT_1213 [Candidatus Jettenia ecosi]|uniref:Cupin 2 conserved barrel domain-containing protein n=1 Tax=Candidatus Jettenia ecosi TaxID=2494326 RepID=A0A533QPG6_9BACT|nr:MAG: hypothetical protein JETT_1213 [Candidatus Jettenia ecosi]